MSQFEAKSEVKIALLTIWAVLMNFLRGVETNVESTDRKTMAEEKEEKKERDPAKVKKLLFLGLLVVNGLCAGCGLFLTYISTIGYSSTPVDEEYLRPELERQRALRDEKPIIYTMEPFTVNLIGENDQIARTVVSLGMLDERGFEEVVTKAPVARDAIVRILQEKKFKDIESIQGKLFLKDQIAQEVNGFLEEGVVRDVYLSDFVVQ